LRKLGNLETFKDVWLTSKVTGEMPGWQRHQIDEVKTGRAIWLDTNHRCKIVTLSKGTSACALT
jgi:hypothetical protein